MAARLLMRGGGKLGHLASKVPGLTASLPGAAALGGAGAAVMGVPGIPAGAGMQGGTGTPITERIYIGSIHKRIYWPGTQGKEPEPEPEPERQWTPSTVTTSFAGMAATTAVATGGVVAAAKAPGLFATWAPRIVIILLVMGLIGLTVYYTFFRKKKKEEDE